MDRIRVEVLFVVSFVVAANVFSALDSSAQTAAPSSQAAPSSKHDTSDAVQSAQNPSNQPPAPPIPANAPPISRQSR
ncbi:MAG: hypothetical protein WBC78_17460, partial [Candidatus Sulfotelmatobacter sp.]